MLTDQLKLELAPGLILVGLALNEIVGAAAAIVLIVTDCAAVPPLPVQVRVYWVVAVSAEVEIVPLSGCAPLQPPDAMHDVAFVELQLNIAVLPLAICDGLAESFTEGFRPAGVLVTGATEGAVLLESVTLAEDPHAVNAANAGISNQ